MDVLLVSPRLPPGHHKYGGDNAYTDTLLAYPPPGVRYLHYEDYIESGHVARLSRLLNANYYLTTSGILPPDMWLEAIETDLQPDLVHVVGFSAVIGHRKKQRQIPVVIEAPSGSVSDLMVKLGWSEARTRRAHLRKKLWLRAIGAFDSNLTSDKAELVIVQSQHSHDLHTKYGKVNPNKLVVLKPPVPFHSKGQTPRDPTRPVRFLFVGGDFDRKNGQLVVEAFRKLRLSSPNITLTLVGRRRAGALQHEERVTHDLTVPRSTLLEDFYPQADVFVLPTSAEGGFAVSIYEAMSFGLPVITVDAWAMRELVEHQRTGLLIPFPPCLEDLVAAMRVFAEGDGSQLQRMRETVCHRFASEFDPVRRQEKLGELYRQALDTSRRVSPSP